MDERNPLRFRLLFLLLSFRYYFLQSAWLVPLQHLISTNPLNGSNAVRFFKRRWRNDRRINDKSGLKMERFRRTVKMTVITRGWFSIRSNGKTSRSRRDQISVDREKMEFSHCAWNWIWKLREKKMILFSVDGIIGKEDKSRRKKRNAHVIPG